jgi:AcrR family transcriptional regulator
MTPRTEQQYEEIRESKKNLILDTALELFATEGYYPTSISKIAERAGISKGLIYNYFKSKEDIIRTIIHKGIDDLFKIIDPNKDGVLTKDEIRYFIEQMFDIMHRDLQFWRLYFMVFMQPPVLKLVETRLSDLIQSSINMLTNHFKSEGYEDPRIEAILLGAILDGTGFHFVMNPDDFPVEKIKERIIKMYC